jgi:hypothetical protein
MRNAYAAVAAMVGWGALALKLGLILGAGSDVSTVGRTINFLSSFTVLSNGAVAVALTVAAVGTFGWRSLGFFTRPTVQTGIAVSITATGVVFLTVLRSTHETEGWPFVADALLHYVMPLFYIGFWSLFVTKGTLWLRDLVGFLGFPVLYLAYSLVRGPLLHWYPYPFLDVAGRGIGEVAINIAAASAALALVGLAYIGIDRLIGRPRGRMAVS